MNGEIDYIKIQYSDGTYTTLLSPNVHVDLDKRDIAFPSTSGRSIEILMDIRLSVLIDNICLGGGMSGI